MLNGLVAYRPTPHLVKRVNVESLSLVDCLFRVDKSVESFARDGQVVDIFWHYMQICIFCAILSCPSRIADAFFLQGFLVYAKAMIHVATCATHRAVAEWTHPALVTNALMSEMVTLSTVAARAFHALRTVFSLPTLVTPAMPFIAFTMNAATPLIIWA